MNQIWLQAPDVPEMEISRDKWLLSFLPCSSVWYTFRQFHRLPVHRLLVQTGYRDRQATSTHTGYQYLQATDTHGLSLWVHIWSGHVWLVMPCLVRARLVGEPCLLGEVMSGEWGHVSWGHVWWADNKLICLGNWYHRLGAGALNDLHKRKARSNLERSRLAGLCSTLLKYVGTEPVW